MTSDNDWEKILAAALISSLFTACLTEPVKVWVQRRLKRRELRRSVYWEMVHNFGALLGQVWMAERDDKMKDGIGWRFEMGYQRLAYDIALKEAPTLYTLRHSELYFITQAYRDFDGVIHKKFLDGSQRLLNAQFVADYVLSHVKNRDFSKRLIFKVSPQWFKEHLRDNLPSTNYIDVHPPSFRERLYRKYDQIQYFVWARLYKTQRHKTT
jgi:hypothetical protein